MMSIQSQTSIKTITHSYFDSPKQDIKMTTEKNPGKVSSLIDGPLDVNERYQNDVHYCTSVWYQFDIHQLASKVVSPWMVFLISFIHVKIMFNWCPCTHWGISNLEQGKGNICGCVHLYNISNWPCLMFKIFVFISFGQLWCP